MTKHPFSVNHPIHVHHSQNVKGRDFFIGDIHGYLTDLSDLLSGVKFDRSVDRLFSTGDLIDRGPQSMQCLQLVNEPWFFPVRGNHENMLLDIFASTGSSRVYAEFMHKANGGQWYSTSKEKPEDAVIQEMLDGMPYFRTVQTAKCDIGLVHAAWIKSWKEAQNLATLSEEDKKVANWTRLDESVLTPVEDIQLLVTGHQNLMTPQKTGNMLCIDTLGRSGEFTLLSADQVLAALVLPEGPVDTELLFPGNQNDKPAALVFIDFDGVLHGLNNSAPMHWHDVMRRPDFFEKTKVQMVVELCKQNQAGLVISSAWRQDYQISDFNEVFEGLVIAVTPQREFDIHGTQNMKAFLQHSRHKEIIQFLEENNFIALPWVAFDDQAKHFPDADNTFITNAETGLTPDIVKQANAWLARALGG